MIKSHRFLLPLAAAFLLPLAASAQLTFNLGASVVGASPAGASPWLTATFSDQGANTIRLTMMDLNLSTGEKVGVWGFNLNPAKNFGSLSASAAIAGSTTSYSSFVSGANIPGSGGENFTFEFNFIGGTSFDPGDKLIVDLTYNNLGDTSLAVSDFNFGSVTNGWGSGAHVQGITTGVGPSGFVAVPEPSTYALMFGAAALGFAVIRRRRSKTVAALA